MCTLFCNFTDKIRKNLLYRRIYSGAFWSILSSVITKSLALAASVVVARVLNKSVVGELGIIQSTVGVLGVLAGLGLGTTATKYVAEYRNTDKIRTGHFIALSSVVAWISSAIMSVALFVFAPLLALQINAPHLVDQLRISALLLFFSGINGSQVGILSGFESFKTITKISFVSGLINFPVLTIGAAVGGLTGALYGLIISLLFGCMLNYFAIKVLLKEHKIITDFMGCYAEKNVLITFSLPVMLLSLIIMPANWFCNVMLARTLDGYSALAEFTISLQWRNLIVFAPNALASVVIPMLSELKGRNDVDDYKHVLKVNLYICAVIAGVLSLLIIVFSSWICKAYGSNFISAQPVIIAMALSGFLIAVNGVVGNAITSFAKPWIGCVFCLLTATSLVAFSYLLIPENKAFGLAMANLVAYTLHTVWQGVYLRKILRCADLVKTA